MCLPSGKEPALPGPPSGHLSRAEEALGGRAVPQAWGLFLAMSYYAIRVPIFSMALLDREVGGRLWGPGHPALHSAQVSPGLLAQNPLVKIVYRV